MRLRLWLLLAFVLYLGWGGYKVYQFQDQVEGVTRTPPEARALRAEGTQLLTKERDFAAAFTAFQDAADLAPMNRYTQFSLALTAFLLDEEDVAIAAVEQVAALTYRAGDRNRSALENHMINIFQETLQNGRPELIYRGITYASLGRPDLARPEFDTYLSEGWFIDRRALRWIIKGRGGYVGPKGWWLGPGDLDEAVTAYIADLDRSSVIHRLQ